jgi:uroporphyrinogen III methyltransferase / synthase
VTGRGRRRRSLGGRVVVVTRPRDQAAELVAALDARGADALLAPAIELTPAPSGPIDRAVAGLAAGDFDWALFTSRHGVQAVFDRLGALGLDGSSVRASVGAVGEGTAEELRARGVDPALVPSAFTTEALSREMPHGSGRILLPRADIAPDGLEAALEAKGWRPVRVDAYLTRLAQALPATTADALRRGRVDAITFTSASTVTGFLRLAADTIRASTSPPRIVCIGPVTGEAVGQWGLAVDGTADPHTIEGLVRALERLLGPAAGKENPSR